MHVSQVVRQTVAVAAVAALGLIGCSGASETDERAATAAQLETHLDTAAWLPAGVELVEASTDPEACDTDCPPVEIGYTFRCSCDDLDGEMAAIQDRVEASGFEIVEPYSSATGRFVARHPDDEIDRGYAWATVQTSSDDGAVITLTIAADDPIAG